MSDFVSWFNQAHEFAFSILKQLLQEIPSGVDYQLWETTTVGDRDLSAVQVNKPNFIIANFDIVESAEFDHTRETVTSGARRILNFVESHPDTHFVLMYGGQNAQAELCHERLDVVRFTHGIARFKSRFQALPPATHKNLHGEKTFVSLNRSPRQHRINLVSYLLGLDLEKHGTISFGDPHKCETWLDRVSWNLSERQIALVKPVLMRGYEKTKTVDLQKTLKDIEIYSWKIVDDVDNFDLRLRFLYQDHFVEIVSQTLFNRKIFGVDEKFLNSVYGSVFPILVAGAGCVTWLRNFGFDMFDDVVDHSYDLIQDPLDRLCAAVDLNRELLTNRSRTQDLWLQNQTRFANNINFAKTTMYEKIHRQALEDFAKVKWNH